MDTAVHPGNMSMLGLIIVDNDYHNLGKTKESQLPRVATSVLKPLIRNAQTYLKLSQL